MFEEEIPIVPVLVGLLLLSVFGLEVERRRSKLRAVFNVVEKKESRLAEFLESMVETGELVPYVPESAARVAAE
jgi:hypothetical protein